MKSGGMGWERGSTVEIGQASNTVMIVVVVLIMILVVTV
jgi:hypothetical protein